MPIASFEDLFDDESVEPSREPESEPGEEFLPEPRPRPRPEPEPEPEPTRLTRRLDRRDSKVGLPSSPVVNLSTEEINKRLTSVGRRPINLTPTPPPTPHPLHQRWINLMR